MSNPIKIRIKIDVKKLEKKHFFNATSGAVYLDATLYENTDGKSPYGDDGRIIQDVSREARERGEKGKIVGNWRHAQSQPKPAPKPAPKPPADPDLDATEEDDIPF